MAAVPVHSYNSCRWATLRCAVALLLGNESRFGAQNEAAQCQDCRLYGALLYRLRGYEHVMQIGVRAETKFVRYIIPLYT